MINYASYDVSGNITGAWAQEDDIAVPVIPGSTVVVVVTLPNVVTDYWNGSAFVARPVVAGVFSATSITLGNSVTVSGMAAGTLVRARNFQSFVVLDQVESGGSVLLEFSQTGVFEVLLILPGYATTQQLIEVT